MAVMIRCKILLTKFLKDSLVEASEASDSSMGDTIRMLISIGLLRSYKRLYPEFGPAFKALKMHDEILEECRKNNYDLEKRKKFVIQVLFECQKAVEYHNKQKDKKFV